MYRIMLADDEGIVIDSMKFIIEKEFGDKCHIEFAKSGRSVIELAEWFRPDITFMDIHMPGINGLQAIEEIRQFSADSIFIIMSAYDKFDYAKEAIKLGVMEYLNKPVDRKKIVETLKTAMNRIDSARKKRSSDLEIKEKLEIVEPIIENGLIYDILLQEQYDEDIENYCTMLSITQEYGYMMSIVCGDAQEGSHMTNAVGSSVRIAGKYREIREVVKDYFDCDMGNVMANKIAVLVPYGKKAMDYAERTELIDRARELARALKKKTDIRFRIGIGGVKPLKELNESHHEALRALLASTGSVAHVDDLPISCEHDEDYPIEMEKPMFEAVSKGDLSGVKLIAGRYADWMCRNVAKSGLMAMRLKVLEFTLYAEHLAYLHGGQTYHYDGRNNYLKEIMDMEGQDELKEWFLEKMTTACNNVRNMREKHSTDIIKSAKQYIDSHFDKDLSLDEVSRTVNISPYYFSKIFKEESGMNFIEYLTNVRIEKAKELLRCSDRSMKEICVNCGYTDPNYFSRSFKKKVGVTPTEYKDMTFA
ncbi:two-component system, response regulator YesN [Lachnospiraceae bacterium KH1T2]|nr:two-component system, response regulator YesN [Lachnospiraceae bacterium KH1T2]